MKKKIIKALIIILIILVIVYTAYMYFLKSTKDLGVIYTEKDYASLISKANVKIENLNGLNVLNLIDGKFTVSDTTNVNASFTNEEITSIIDKANAETGPFYDIKIKFLEGNKMETTFKVNEDVLKYFESNPSLNAKINEYSYLKSMVLDTPIYVKANLTGFTLKRLQGNIEQVNLGNVSMPAEVVKEAENILIPMVNTIIGKVNGFEIENISTAADKFNFKGKVPKVITGK